MRFPRLQSIDEVVDVLVVQVLGCRPGGVRRDPSVAACCCLDAIVDMPVGVQQQMMVLIVVAGPCAQAQGQG